jgi:hypothetical protein
MSENLSIKILSLCENGIELPDCSCIVILGSTILAADIPTIPEIIVNATTASDEEILSILIKQNGENIVKSFIPLGSLRKDRHYQLKLEPLGVKAEIGSTFTLDSVFAINGEVCLETKTNNPFHHNLYKTEAFTTQDFYATFKTEDYAHEIEREKIIQDAKFDRYGVVPIETQSISYFSPPSTSPQGYQVQHLLESVEIRPREEVQELKSQSEVNHLIQELRNSMEVLEKNIESKTSVIHYDLGNTATISHEYEQKNFAQSAPIYSTEQFHVRAKENYSPEFGSQEFHYTGPSNINIFSDHQVVRGSHHHVDKWEAGFHAEKQSSALKNERRSSRHYTETARSAFEDVKIEKNATYLLTLKNQLSSKHISFINDAFTRDVILYMAQSKKKVSAVYLKRSITIRDKEEVDIDKNEYFNANCVSKFIHFFQPNAKVLNLYSLSQPVDHVDESAKKVTLNIDFDISPFHKSVITPAGMIFIASARTEYINFQLQTGSNTLHVYNYKNHTLFEKPSMMCENRKEFGLCYMSKNVFAIGGVVNGAISNKCERFDIRANKWVKIAPMTRPLREVSLCSFNNRYLYRFFGIDSGNNIDHSIERYDAVRDTWTVMNVPMNETIKEIYIPFCTQISKDCIFLFGGQNINGFSPKSCNGWVLKVEDKRGSNNAELVESKNFIPGLAGTFNQNSLLTHAGDIIFLRESY